MAGLSHDTLLNTLVNTLLLVKCRSYKQKLLQDTSIKYEIISLFYYSVRKCTDLSGIAMSKSATAVAILPFPDRVVVFRTAVL